MLVRNSFEPDPSTTLAGGAAVSTGSSVDHLEAAMQSGSIVSQIESQIENFRRLCNETTRRAADLEARENEARRLAEEVIKREHELKEKVESFGRQSAEASARVDAESAKLEESRRSYEHDRQRVEQARAELEQRQQELESKRAEADAIRTEVADKEREVREREASISAMQTQAQQAAEDAARQRTDAQAHRDRAEKLASDALSKLNYLETELSNAMMALAQAFADRERLENQRGDLQRQLDTASAHPAGASVAESSEVSELRELLVEAGRIDSQRAVAQSALTAEVEKLKDAQSTAQARALAAEERAQKLAEERDKLAARPSAAETGPGSMHAQLVDVQAELTQREDALRVLSERLLHAEELTLSHQGEVAGLMAELENAKAKLAESARGGHPPAAAMSLSGEEAGWLIRRRTRLERYKSMLTAQSEKIVRAKAALKRRAEECEQVLQQRQKLAEATQVVAKQQVVLAVRAAKKGAAALVAYAVITLAVVGFIGYSVAANIAPATFAATATLSADLKGRTATDDELAAWSESIKALSNDPVTVTSVGENFSRRGMISLASAAAVKQKLDKEMFLSEDKPGSIKVEMRGPGRERAMRELETYVTTLASEAERLRVTRADGAATVISAAAQAGSEPIESERLIYTLAITGGGFIACAITGFGIYRMLLRSRMKFEQEQLALESA